MSVRNLLDSSPTPTKGRAGSTGGPTRTLALDPGKLTGYALLTHTRRGTGALELAGTIETTRDPHQTALALHQLLQDARPDRVVIEGWESQGKRVNIHSSTPNLILGMLAALTALTGTPFHVAYASEWKPQYGMGAEYLPAPPQKIPKADEYLARRLQHDLKTWPDALALLKPTNAGHAVNASALAVWATSAVT